MSSAWFGTGADSTTFICRTPSGCPCATRGMTISIAATASVRSIRAMVSFPTHAWTILWIEAHMKRIGFLALLSAVLVIAARPSAMIPDQVRIETGALSGVVGATQPAVRVFKGIPYAAPPLGENRWRAPQPVAKWDGVRKADAFGAPCAAGAPFGGRGGGRGARGGVPGQPAAAPAPPREPERSEDCLYLNVWTSATSSSDKRPVMLWIYGGGFTGGGRGGGAGVRWGR